MNLKTLSLYNIIGFQKISTSINEYQDFASKEFLEWLYEIDAMLYEEVCFEALLIPCSPLFIEIDPRDLSECFVGYAIGCDFEQITDNGDVKIIDRIESNNAIYFCDRLIVEDNFKQEKEKIKDYFNERQIKASDINKIYILFSQGVFSSNNDEIEYFLEIKYE